MFHKKTTFSSISPKNEQICTQISVSVGEQIKTLTVKNYCIELLNKYSMVSDA